MEIFILTITGLTGIFQGILGWLMVKSGFNRPAFVSPYYLSFHLITAYAGGAFLTLLLKLSTNLGTTRRIFIVRAGIAGIFLMVLQIFAGALVSGSKGGYIYNTFPLMGEKLVPDEVFLSLPFSEWLVNPGISQFIHRSIAYMLLLWAISVIIMKWKEVFIPAIFIFIQFTIGVINVMAHNNTYTALLHQIFAYATWISLTWYSFTWREISR